MLKDVGFNNIQVFAPTDSAIYDGLVIPVRDIVIVPADDVTITINGNGLTYKSGTAIGLWQGISYTFSASTVVHVMG